MSEYVESRYAKLVLQEARLAEEDVASRLVNQLLRDLGSPQGLNSARTQALTSIRSLARSLDQPRSRHAREWDAADQAAEAWCQNAYHWSAGLQFHWNGNCAIDVAANEFAPCPLQAARRCELTTHLDEWLSSPVLQPPK
jgi:hypothetical protein